MSSRKVLPVFGTEPIELDLKAVSKGAVTPVSPSVNKHPCFGADAKGKKGRLHLPVAPFCNIGCMYCSRAFDDVIHMPGVARTLVKPQDVAPLVAKALELVPHLTVVGVAGPGDPLASDHALIALAEVRKHFPDLVPCLSTNGLTLDDRAQDVHDVGVETITVTVNGLDPEVVSKIIRFARKGDRLAHGLEAAALLTDSQLSGISKMIALGATVKVNSVLVPGINDHEIQRVAERVAKLGAQFINVIPLIPQHQLKDLRAPTCDELAKARDDAEQHLKVFRNCGQCRADACGIPGGKDLGRELFGGDAPHTFSHG